MAAPQLEDGFIKTANTLELALARTNFSPYESRVLRAVVIKTYGWNKKFDRIAFSQFTEITNLPRQNAARAMASLVARNIVIRRGTGHKLEYGIQKDYEKWLATSPPESTILSSPEMTSEATDETSSAESTPEPAQAQTSSPELKVSSAESTKTSSPESHTKDKKDTTQKTDILSVFDFWNSLKIIVHDKLTTSMETAIRNTLTEFGMVKVMQAMTNYGQLLSGDYDWTYKWTLQDFLTRGKGNNIERFKDMAVLRQNYGRKGNGTAKTSGVHGEHFGEAKSGNYTKPPAFRE